MIPTEIYRVQVRTFDGADYSTFCTSYPDLSDIKDIVKYEIDALQREGHTCNEGFRITAIWRRVAELKRVLDVMLVPLEEPNVSPYTVSVVLAGTEVGSINVAQIPAFSI